MATNASIQDEWSPLSFISALGGEMGKPPVGAPRYFPLSDQRRMRAYDILQGLLSNTRREYLGHDSKTGLSVDATGRPRHQTPDINEYREYGDPQLLVDSARALILGDEQQVVTGTEEDPAPDAFTEWVNDWVKREQLSQKLLLGENDTIGKGDGVYVLGVSTRAGRPKLRVEDPGFYFPDHLAEVEGWDDEDYPPVVHLCWEYDNPEDDNRSYTKRITYRMERLAVPATTPWGGTREWACMYSVVECRTDKIANGHDVYSLDFGRDTVVLEPPRDLRVDFIPVVHVPNTPGEWGRSILTLVAQLIDDIQSADSDLAIALQTASPKLVTDTEDVPVLSGQPGEVVGLGEGKRAQYVAASLAGMIEVMTSLQKRLAQNSRLGEVLMGRVAPNEVPSGVALELGFHQARQLMRDARTVRDQKFPLLLKFALRLAQAWGQGPGDGETPEFSVALGSSLPSDRSVAVDTVTKLLDAHAISTATAVNILVEAGFPIDDALDEATRIRAERTEDMVRVVDALGIPGADLVQQWLDDAAALQAKQTTAQSAADNGGQSTTEEDQQP